MSVDDLIEFLKCRDMQEILKRAKENSLFRCVYYGHDFREVGEPEKICLCCGVKEADV